jgi:hypothetical protein
MHEREIDEAIAKIDTFHDFGVDVRALLRVFEDGEASDDAAILLQRLSEKFKVLFEEQLRKRAFHEVRV